MNQSIDVAAACDAQPARRRRFRRIAWIALALVAVPAGWFAVGRATAASRALRIIATDEIRSDATPDPPDPRERTEADEAAPDLLRVVTYNIAHGRGSGAENWNGESRAVREDRLARIADFLKATAADLVVLNEVDFDSSWSHGVNQAEFLARRAGYAYRLEQRNFDVSLPGANWACGNAVLSRHPIESAAWLTLPWDSVWESVFGGKKDACVATVRLPGDRLMRVVPVHLSYRSERVRVASVAAIRAAAVRSDAPMLILGDFNSTPVGFPESDPDGQSALGNLLKDGNWTTQPVENPAEPDFTFSSTRPTQVIDWICVPRPWELISKQVYPLELSDHRPVVGQVRIVMPARSPVRASPP